MMAGLDYSLFEIDGMLCVLRTSYNYAISFCGSVLLMKLYTVIREGLPAGRSSRNFIHEYPPRKENPKYLQKIGKFPGFFCNPQLLTPQLLETLSRISITTRKSVDY